MANLLSLVGDSPHSLHCAYHRCILESKIRFWNEIQNLAPQNLTQFQRQTHNPKRRF
ncbi:hypothetical protein [uncultured Helicobacter sp.]|uniref:hypothetical protein n=1 Tax=uncultured Helicobacter sp. TaxID=175537 RepID=UPI0037537DE0